MQIISHRGYWKDMTERNQPVAFERSFTLGFGTETDLRDRNGEIVISHDMADDTCISLSHFLDIYAACKDNVILALNIKADGLQRSLKQSLEERDLKNYFVFDMSIPDTLGYTREGIRFFSRQSEYEPQPALYDDCAGIWLDAFMSTWYQPSLILEHVRRGKQVAIVSPDLHKRDYNSFWDELKKHEIHKIEEVILCTDHPEDAQQFFTETIWQ